MKLRTMHYVDTLLLLVASQLRSKYSGSIFGIMWTVLQPLSVIILFVIVFSYIIQIKIDPALQGTNSFALWLTSGLLPWFFFSESLTSGTYSLLNQSQLIKRTTFPSFLIPTTQVLLTFLHHLVAMALFVSLSSIKVQISFSILLLPAFMLFLLLFALGLAFIFSSINVFFRDVGHILGLILNIWFYATPIVYPQQYLPSCLRNLVVFNPMYWMIEAYRGTVFGYLTSFWSYLVICSLVSITTFCLGTIIILKLRDFFPDLV